MEQTDKNDATFSENKGISNFYDLESLLKELLPQKNQITSEKAEFLYGIFIVICKEKMENSTPDELSKALDCLNLLESFNINNDAREGLKPIKSRLTEMANISSMRAANSKRMIDLMNTMSQPKKNNSGCMFIFLVAIIVISFGFFFSCKKDDPNSNLGDSKVRNYFMAHKWLPTYSQSDTLYFCVSNRDYYGEFGKDIARFVYEDDFLISSYKDSTGYYVAYWVRDFTDYGDYFIVDPKTGVGVVDGDITFTGSGEWYKLVK